MSVLFGKNSCGIGGQRMTDWYGAYVPYPRDLVVTESFTHPAIDDGRGVYHISNMKFQSLFQPCPICGKAKSYRAKTCRNCAIKGSHGPKDFRMVECKSCGQNFEEVLILKKPSEQKPDLPDP